MFFVFQGLSTPRPSRAASSYDREALPGGPSVLSPTEFICLSLCSCASSSCRVPPCFRPPGALLFFTLAPSSSPVPRIPPSLASSSICEGLSLVALLPKPLLGGKSHLVWSLRIYLLSSVGPLGGVGSESSHPCMAQGWAPKSPGGHLLRRMSEQRNESSCRGPCLEQKQALGRQAVLHCLQNAQELF